MQLTRPNRHLYQPDKVNRLWAGVAVATNVRRLSTDHLPLQVRLYRLHRLHSLQRSKNQSRFQCSVSKHFRLICPNVDYKIIYPLRLLPPTHLHSQKQAGDDR
uniref:Uncharacterized protein n=1 Tax=Anopheles culicifacies TaxID=139723 RepID=A0A182M0Z7_9DIPT